ncbi:hypothetical protein [Nocardia sp. 348MFTsu5.1]|uniref:hypothetical protein n=1 Tax=Nocardia sp. 348MFTsu5.1 TaxID=1172185 RepID=UPI000364CA21|nr:hypothetical protein [Nocardia sp. 348MFTsu5.1]
MDITTPASDIEARIRGEAERKIAAVHTLKEIHNEIIEEREAFLTRDSDRRRRLGEALAQAKKAGFSDAELKDWRVDPVGSRKRVKVRRTPAKNRGESPDSSNAATEASTTAATASDIADSRPADQMTA